MQFYGKPRGESLSNGFPRHSAIPSPFVLFETKSQVIKIKRYLKYKILKEKDILL